MIRIIMLLLVPALVALAVACDDGDDDAPAPTQTEISGESPEPPTPGGSSGEGAQFSGTVTIDGVAITAAEFQELVGASMVTTGRQITFATPAPTTLLTGPVVMRGANGKPSATYRFIHVRD